MFSDHTDNLIKLHRLKDSVRTLNNFYLNIISKTFTCNRFLILEKIRYSDELENETNKSSKKINFLVPQIQKVLGFALMIQSLN